MTTQAGPQEGNTHTHSVPNDTETKRRARKGVKNEHQQAMEDASKEIADIDVKLNRFEVQRRKFLEKYKGDTGKLSAQRSAAVIKLRAATEAMAKRDVPGVAPSSAPAKP